MAVLPNTRYVQFVARSNPATFSVSDMDLGQVHRVHLKNYVIPNTEYNVNSRTKSVNITAADMIAVADLPEGQYTMSTFLAALKVVLDVAANPNTFTITQDALSQKLIFTKSAGAEFTIGANSAIDRLIGQYEAASSVGLTLTGASIPDLSGLRMCIIKSYTLGKYRISDGDTTDEKGKISCIGSMVVDVPFGALLKKEETEESLNNHAFAGYKNLSTFDITLVNTYNEPLELNGNQYILDFEVHTKGAN